MHTLSRLQQILSDQYPDIELRAINTADFVMEERVRVKCFHCPCYNYKWTCPPRLANVNYSKLFSEYKHAAVVMLAYPLREVGIVTEQENTDSANRLHHAMLALERELFKHNYPLAHSFIGCNCRLCVDGCPADKCARPYEARSPWEATGVNVVETLKSIGVEVSFPPKSLLNRFGLILW